MKINTALALGALCFFVCHSSEATQTPVLFPQQKNISRISDGPENPFLYVKHLSQTCHPTVINWITYPDLTLLYIDIGLFSFHALHSQDEPPFEQRWEKEMGTKEDGTIRWHWEKTPAPVESMGLFLCLKGERWEQNRAGLRGGAWKIFQINTGVCWKDLKFWLLSLPS